MAEDEKIPKTFLEKLLFYTTATFILLGTFSLFAFLFLVPFVIDPAFTTIFMQFDTTPAQCLTVETAHRYGVSNCTWSSCREGCTKDVFDCLQIRVHYKRSPGSLPLAPRPKRHAFYDDDDDTRMAPYEDRPDDDDRDGFLDDPLPTGLMGNDSEWFFTWARLFPNVKGCGYPPILNCTIFYGKYRSVGSNFTCYYSRVDPGLVITDLDMWQNTLNLVYAMAIPIPSFIISVIYLTVAYFKIYNDDEEAAPLERNAEGIAAEGDADTERVGGGGGDSIGSGRDGIGGGTVGGCSAGGDTPGSDTFREDLASYEHQLRATDSSRASRPSCCSQPDRISRCSLEGGAISNSGSIQGNLSKTMTTSISTPPGPIAAV